MPITMSQILADDALFEDHFCSATTIAYLRSAPPNVLRRVLSQIYELTGTSVFASPRTQTPENSGEKKVVVAGNSHVTVAQRVNVSVCAPIWVGVHDQTMLLRLCTFG